MASFVLKKTPKGKFHFNLLASNNEIILTSETYNDKDGAKNGIESVRKNSKLDARYELKKSRKGLHMFNLKALNGKVIGTSEEYSSESGMKNGIASVKKIAATAKVVDETK